MMSDPLSPAVNSKSFDFLVFIGRFQPFHLGHWQIIDAALKQAQQVIVLVGSSQQPRSIRNPWSFTEREHFIRSAFPAEVQTRLHVLPIVDDMYNDQNWIARVQQAVQSVVDTQANSTPHIGLIGHSKDETSYYLSLFPQWDSVSVPSYQNGLSATPLREQYFLTGVISDQLPPSVQQQLAQFKTTADYQQVAEEWQFVRQYQQGWANAPYPPTFVTVDAVVIQAGHVLLIQRRARPGKGLWALPGGFVNQDETLRDAVIRELREETRIKIPAPVLQGSISKTQVFDHPDRSSRGRTITHAYLIELKPDAQGLPKVKGSDDAQAAKWVPLSTLNPEHFFEDHYHIITALVG
ncbi:MAG: bifunctional nicotinamide-nucleotide adenylyltransferase/Nudix hydroxylase [Thiofilum sp.]|uniref:bifunctional nicotinamide-nucleotide adenylyltransferase/Nudix hydroxylase n=1 Tax=Thiofilum sp. TaxID=2212733 RepID=UPI0025D17577|nr:bifunctional nicotinamide-nucleotide adenylyltransferase/Nudix hydroxylase [Thiofilum sp.]